MATILHLVGNAGTVQRLCSGITMYHYFTFAFKRGFSLSLTYFTLPRYHFVTLSNKVKFTGSVYLYKFKFCLYEVAKNISIMDQFFIFLGFNGQFY